MLQADVQSPGTCFSIEADDITLDLNGHTATYANAANTFPTFGVLAADCWYKPIAGNPCGGSHRHPVVMNGRIVQGAGAAPFSHGLRFGQANNLTGISIHNLNITVHAEDSIGIYAEYLPGGSDIYGNTIVNQVRVISSRTQFRGASIKLDEERTAKLPDMIHDNVIKGGVEIGIRSDNPAGTKISRNDISQDAIYANGFCIDAAGDNMQISENHCHPVHGRGIHANHTNVTVDHNIVETVDGNQIAEYHGCEQNGTYGIQVENDEYNPRNMVVAYNKVTVHARECPAEAMRITDLHNTAIQVHDNIFTAVQDEVDGKRSEQGARAFSTGDVDGEGMEIHDNVMTADSAIFHEDWDSANNMTLRQNTLHAGRAGTHTLLAEFGNGVKQSQNIFFVDNDYVGFSPLGAHFGEYAADSWYDVAHSLSIVAKRSDGRPLQEAHAVVKDANDNTLAFGDLGAQGKLLLDVPLHRVENKQPVRNYTPSTLVITSPGCKDSSTQLKSLSKDPLEVTLICQ